MIVSEKSAIFCPVLNLPILVHQRILDSAYTFRQYNNNTHYKLQSNSECHTYRMDWRPIRKYITS